MKLKYLLRHVRRDLKLIKRLDSNSGREVVYLDDVDTLLVRWENALEDEQMLKVNERRFQSLLNKDGALTSAEEVEALKLVQLIHKPLITGYNDVIGVRLRDADYLRLMNKIAGRDLEFGLDDYEHTLEKAADEERERFKAEKRRIASAKRRKEEERRKRDKEDMRAVLREVIGGERSE